MIEMNLGSPSGRLEALEKAATMNLAVTVSVVDEAGRLVLTMRGSDGIFHHGDIARQSGGGRGIQASHARSGRIAED